MYNLIRNLGITLLSEFMHPIRASKQEAQVRIDAPILTYCLHG